MLIKVLITNGRYKQGKDGNVSKQANVGKGHN